MLTKSLTRGRGRKSMNALRVISSVALAAVSLAVAASPAAAFTVTSSGSPGVTTTPFTYGDYGSWSSVDGSTITAPARTVYESSFYSSYDQYVCVTPRLWTFKTGQLSWSYDLGLTNCAWIRGASTSALVQGAVFSKLMPYTGFSVDIKVTWQFANGAPIGTKYYDYNTVNDYRCLDPTPYCVIQSGALNWNSGAFIGFEGYNG